MGKPFKERTGAESRPGYWRYSRINLASKTPACPVGQAGVVRWLAELLFEFGQFLADYLRQ